MWNIHFYSLEGIVVEVLVMKLKYFYQTTCSLETAKGRSQRRDYRLVDYSPV